MRPPSPRSGCRAELCLNVRSTDPLSLAADAAGTGSGRVVASLAFSQAMIDANGQSRSQSGEEVMSRAVAVFHARFGRATVYQLNRPFNVHAHREGHLIFHVGGTPAQIDVCDRRWQLIEDSVVAVNPWEPHNFLPRDTANGGIFFVLYVNHEWFAPDSAGAQNLRFGKTHFKRTDALEKHIRRTAALVCGAPSLRSLDCELRQLIDSCYEESWQPSKTAQQARAAAGITDFRVRKSIKLMSES